MKKAFMWLKGLLVATVAGAAPVVHEAIQHPETIAANWRGVAVASASAATVAAIAYAMKSPKEQQAESPKQ